ncbi:MAG: NAD(P)-dependent oxidoreductase [Acidobacteriota bacterium]|nr:NAD(P)-dependent oxidoreductase [Acidobacteriota bacterium]
MIGFVGFGEAGFNLAKGLSGVRMHAYDIGVTGLVRARAAEAHVTLVDSNAALARSSEIVFSVVTASQALNAARQTAPYLEARHLYADMNSVSPALKQSIANVIGPGFVEVAIMAPVPPYGHKVPMLAGGPKAADFAGRLSLLGMRIEVGDTCIGAAAATKMCRSIVVKGMEAILTECALGATKYGAADRVFSSLAESFPGIDWNKLASYMVSRVVVHGERRAREMEEVAETLRSIGVEPIMAEAAARRMDWSAKQKLKSKFGPEGPKSYEEFACVVHSASSSS